MHFLLQANISALEMHLPTDCTSPCNVLWILCVRRKQFTFQRVVSLVSALLHGYLPLWVSSMHEALDVCTPLSTNCIQCLDIRCCQSPLIFVTETKFHFMIFLILPFSWTVEFWFYNAQFYCSYYGHIFPVFTVVQNVYIYQKISMNYQSQAPWFGKVKPIFKLLTREFDKMRNFLHFYRFVYM